MARKTKKIPVRDEFLIVTNGKRSEKDYFEILRNKIKSIYKIKVKFINGDPGAVVDFAMKEKSKSTALTLNGKKGISKEKIFLFSLKVVD